MIWILCTPLFFLFIELYSLVDFKKMKYGKDKLKAKVVEYRNERTSMRNNYTKIPYPYVQIGDDKSLVKLKYASSWSKSFEIGEEIEVFYNDSILYYWHVDNVGLAKYLPKKWGFWNN